MTNRDLSRALRAAADGLPGNPHRFDEVARRVRRRRRAILAGMTALVLLSGSAVTVSLSALRGQGEPNQVAVAAQPTCPGSTPGARSVEQTGTGPLVPDGAIAARLCPIPGPDAGGAAPEGTLRKGVDGLIAELGKLPAARPEARCPMVAGPSYALVIDYPDRDSVVVWLDTSACGAVRAGDEQRFGARAVVEYFTKVMKRPGRPTALSCPKPSGGPGSPGSSGTAAGSGPLVADGAVAARFCPGVEAAELPQIDQKLARAVITRGVDQLVEAVNGLQAVPVDPICTEELGPTYDLVLAYPDGRQKVVAFEDYGCGFARSGDAFRLGAKALPELGRRLVAGPSGSELTCPPAKPLGSPSRRSSGQGGPLVRVDGVIHARICAHDRAFPADVILDQDRASAIAQRLAGLPPVDPEAACTMELGRTYDIVLGYRDGAPTTVTFEAYGCGFAKQGEQFRMGAKHLGRFVLGLADQQRVSGTPVEAELRCRAAEQLEPGPGGFVSLSYGALSEPVALAPPQPPVAAKLCRYSTSDPKVARLTGQEDLTSTAAIELRDLIAADNGQGAGCDRPTGPLDIVMFADRAGGVYELAVVRGSCPVMYGAGMQGRSTPQIRAAIDGVLGPR